MEIYVDPISYPSKVALLLTVVLHVGAHYLLENPLQSLAQVLAFRHTVQYCHVSIKYVYCLLFTVPRFNHFIGSRVYLSAQIFLHPRLKMVLERGSFEQMTWLGMFGAKTWKPVKLVSSSDRVQGFYRQCRAKGVSGLYGNGRQISQTISMAGYICFLEYV